MVSDLMDGVADATVDVLREAQNSRSTDRGFMGAMANGVGLVAVRLCMLMMTIIVGGIAFIAKSTVDGIHDEVRAVAVKMDVMSTTFSEFAKTSTATSNENKLDIIRLQDQQAANQTRFNDYLRSAVRTDTAYRP